MSGPGWVRQDKTAWWCSCRHMSRQQATSAIATQTTQKELQHGTARVHETYSKEGGRIHEAVLLLDMLHAVSVHKVLDLPERLHPVVRVAFFQQPRHRLVAMESVVQRHRAQASRLVRFYETGVVQKEALRRFGIGPVLVGERGEVPGQPCLAHSRHGPSRSNTSPAVSFDTLVGLKHCEKKS